MKAVIILLVFVSYNVGYSHGHISTGDSICIYDAMHLDRESATQISSLRGSVLTQLGLKE